MGDQIMTVTEVAKYLKVNDRTVYRMATSGEIPAFKVGASWRFKQTELEAWMEQLHNQKGRNSSEKEG
jgi:excisionase family DNA binding protein